METANPLDTSSANPTQNPQSSTGAPGASDAADFQEAASSEALNQQAEGLTVETTGEPAAPGSRTTPSTDNTFLVWGIGLALVVAVALVILARIRREEAAAVTLIPAAEPVKKAVTKKKAATKAKPKSTAKKTTRRKATKRRK